MAYIIISLMRCLKNDNATNILRRIENWSYYNNNSGLIVQLSDRALKSPQQAVISNSGTECGCVEAGFCVCSALEFKTLSKSWKGHVLKSGGNGS